MTLGYEPLSDREFRDEMVKIMPPLRAFARGLCGQRELADDLAQESLACAWAARHSFAKGTNFRAWMYTILRNQFYSNLRKNWRTESWDPDLAAQQLIAPGSPLDALHLNDVSSALQKLPAKQREVLMLVGAGGMPYEEAAEVIGCAIGTIKSRLARGRAALTALIDGTPIDEDADFDDRNAALPEQLQAAP
mgnify:CR=1 FL=1